MTECINISNIQSLYPLLKKRFIEMHSGYIIHFFCFEIENICTYKNVIALFAIIHINSEDTDYEMLEMWKRNSG